MLNLWIAVNVLFTAIIRNNICILFGKYSVAHTIRTGLHNQSASAVTTPVNGLPTDFRLHLSQSLTIVHMDCSATLSVPISKWIHCHVRREWCSYPRRTTALLLVSLTYKVCVIHSYALFKFLFSLLLWNALQNNEAWILFKSVS